MRVDRVRATRRLAALRGSGLLDATAAPSLERLSRLAVKLLGVPVSLVSLVDEDRQFFAAQSGLTEPWASLRETPLSHSLCQYVVQADAPMVVSDARTDSLLAENLALRDLGVIAYAGMPLRLANGETVGSFCAIDAIPRAWEAQELTILEDLAALAAEIIDLHHAQATGPLHDGLTGLATRELLYELIERALAEARRSRRAVAVLAIDLDGFRLVNEALGHAAGDRILITAAERLSAQLRDNDAVCRLDADEFAVLCDGVSDEREALKIAQRIRDTLAGTPFSLDGHEHALSATVGVVLAVGDAATVSADELVQAASAALRRAKTSTDRAPGQADPAQRARAVTQLQTRSSIAGAHERGELRLVYQPIKNLHSGQLVSCEALVRWDHPQLGLVSPNDFIPEAERSGAIVALGEWILQRACTDLAQWRHAYPENDLSVAVNIAPVQLRVASLPDIVASTLHDTGLPPAALTLEIIERTLLDDRALYRHSLNALQRIGVRIALDDFGTGYSALGYLTRFPIDLLKLDRSLIATVADDPQTNALIKGILAMADGLGMRTLAEGIETDAQLQALRTLGCRLGQGYHLGRPAPAEAITTTLAINRPHNPTPHPSPTPTPTPSAS